MKIIGYTYEADYHCGVCTEKRFRHGVEWVEGSASDLDENGVPFTAKDREGNIVRPIFSTDETPPDSICSGCESFIN